jgi:DNA polymerase I
VLVSTDLSQIELRIAAKISGDQRLRDAFLHRQDLHTLTAQSILGLKEVTKEQRQLAKALNFGLLYGMGAASLQTYARVDYGINLTERQAAAYRERFFRTYPGLRRWHREVGSSKSKETRTLGGRRRLLTDETSYTQILNTPVQGTGADGIKEAIALLWERREACPEASLVLAIHDELVAEVPTEKAEAAKAWLEAAMKDGIAPLVAPVPVEVETTIEVTEAE